MQVAERNVAAAVEVPEDFLVDLLTPDGHPRESAVPGPVALVDHVAYLVHGPLGRVALSLEKRDEVVVDSLFLTAPSVSAPRFRSRADQDAGWSYQIFAVRQDVVDAAQRLVLEEKTDTTTVERTPTHRMTRSEAVRMQI